MKASIPRTATLAWSPRALDSVAQPYIATGTVAGALDDSFSNESVLEIWQPGYSGESEQLSPVASVSTGARFNRLTWGHIHSTRPKGVLAGGFENGELALWDADKIISSAGDAEILRNNQHTGPVRGLDFNNVQTNLLASGGVNGEIFIWDLTNPTRPFSPGARSNKLDEITALAWNAKVPQILATSSNSGNTVVWDLKGKREVAVLTYGGGAGAGVGAMGNLGINGGASGRRGVGSVCWHPEQPTRLVTSSEDDNNPVIMVWNLRNALAPELILSGHSKGILSMSWCKQDEDLLVSCGKDNRTILWNPQTGEMVGELPSSNNWTFDVQWSPRNPDLLATASFDGKIGVHSLQAISANDQNAATAAAAQAQAQAGADGADFFNNLPTTAAQPGVSLKQPPKWLRRPVSAGFAFGGQLVSVANLTGPTGKVQSSVVHIRDVVSEPTIVERAHRLQEALASQSLAAFCDEKSKEAHARPDDATNWKALQTLFKADSRDELVTLLGFSKDDVAAKVATAVSSFKEKSGAANITTAAEAKAEAQTAAEVADAAVEAKADADADADKETATATTDEPASTTAATESEAAPTEATTEEPSLFGDDAAAPASAAAADDFFGQIGSGEAPKSAVAEHAATTNGTAAAPAAATTTESKVASTFRIYPSNESEADKLITRALVLGDFESAVSLCISADRFADAILLAVRGGDDLFAKTQKLYFEQKTASTPYLRLYQSVVSDDLGDVVQNADLTEWQEIFVVLCTFARSEDFGNLAEQLGQRLELQHLQGKSKDARKNAVMCYLAAGKLEKVANIWIDEMQEEEKLIRSGHSAEDAAGLYSAHAEALQTFIEKIIVFQHAVGYVDTDLSQQPTGDAYATENGLRIYKLAALYDRIHEYVDLLADQGLITPALSFINQIPADYRSSKAAAKDIPGGPASPRERLQRASLARPSERTKLGAAASVAPAAAAASTSASAAQAYAPAASDPYSVPAAVSAASSNPYAPQAPDPYSIPQAQPYQQAQPAYDPYGYGAAPQIQQQATYAPPQPMIPAPPQPTAIAPPPPANLNNPLPPPPPLKRDMGTGWNDVPDTLAAPPRRTTSAMGAKSQPITSPFPNSPAPAPYGAQPAATPPAPPQGPPRGMTPSRGTLTSPPPPQQAGGYAAQVTRPNVQVGAPPPPRGPPGVQQPPGITRAPSAAGIGRPGFPPQAPQQQPGVNPPPPGPYGPPAGMQNGTMRPPIPQQPPNLPQPPPAAPPRMGTPGLATGPAPGSGAGAPPRSQTPAKAVPQSKYPPGDRSHIPEAHKPIFNVLSQELGRFKSAGHPKRMVDDVEARVNLLFDGLNCETIDAKLIPVLHQLCQAIASRNANAALGIHAQLVTSASGDLTKALVGVKQLISKMK